MLNMIEFECGCIGYHTPDPLKKLYLYRCDDPDGHYGNGRSEDEHTSGTTSPSESRTRLMTITADFGRGSSGAPVLDARGAVVGVARKTKSIYHNSEDDAQRRLQMVLKHCVPLQALRDLGLRSVTG